MPADSPAPFLVPLTMRDSLHTALQNRPDISQAIRQVRSSAIQIGVASQDILPQLDLVVNSYVSGLDTGSDLATAFGNSFGQGRPGYSAGFLFEVPVGRRAARARLQGQEWEMRRAIGEFQLTVEHGLTDVEIAVREVETSYREMVSKYQAVVAAENEASYLMDRWREVPGMDDSSTLLLEDLLDAQPKPTASGRSAVDLGDCLIFVRCRSLMPTFQRQMVLSSAAMSRQAGWAFYITNRCNLRHCR